MNMHGALIMAIFHWQRTGNGFTRILSFPGIIGGIIGVWVSCPWKFWWWLAWIRRTNHNLSLKKAPQQPSGIICAAGVQFMPFIPQDRPKNIIWSLDSPIPIVIHEFHVIGVGRDGVWGDFGSIIQRSLVNLLPNPWKAISYHRAEEQKNLPHLKAPFYLILNVSNAHKGV